ncbi:fimbria/pilus periplasmic chaperone [Cetobacterium sp.]|uniref:fimbria/pilus periplasmic chaperone n=2 Tax=Cetobacterium sp. TaxID=2071632 RepID=UPI0025BFE0CE|nr:fimbria/pilus periplasmic chaperone [Cetobacterium sp.]
MKKIYVYFIAFILVFSTTFSFHIAPTFFEKRIDGPGGYQEFTLYNNTTHTQRFKVEFHESSGNFKGSSHTWTEYSPKIVTIKPKSQSIVKVFMKAPKETLEGEYSTYINFKTIPVPELKDEKDNVIQAANKLMLNVSLEIVGYVGNLKPNLEIKDLKVKSGEEAENQVEFKVLNKTLKRGIYMTVRVVENNENFESYEIGRVGANSERDVTITLKNIKKSNVKGIQIIETTSGDELIKKVI